MFANILRGAKQASPSLVALSVLLVAAACSSYPGTTHSGRNAWVGGVESDDFKVTQITPELVRTLNAEQASRIQPAAGKAPIKQKTYSYTVGKGDELVVSVMVQGKGANGVIGYQRMFPSGSNSSAEESIQITESGNISIPHIGDVKAIGKTIGYIQNDMQKRLEAYFKAPQVSVRLLTSNSKTASVTGEVENSGEIVLGYRPLTLIDALEQSGGALESADLHNAIITKKNGKIIPVDLAALLEKGNRKYNYTLFDGDILHIPANHRNQVMIMGEIVVPGAQFIADGNLSLAGALAEAGGLNLITAAEAEIYVMRSTHSPHNAKKAIPLDDSPLFANVYQLDARSPKAYAVADHFMLKPRDVIYVSTSAITDWSRFINQLLPNALTTLTDPRRYEN